MDDCLGSDLSGFIGRAYLRQLDLQATCRLKEVTVTRDSIQEGTTDMTESQP